MPDVRRLHARERQLTSEVSESSTPRGGIQRSTTESRMRNCETEVESSKFDTRFGVAIEVGKEAQSEHASTDSEKQ